MLYDYSIPTIAAKPNEIKHQARIGVRKDAKRAYQIMRIIGEDSEIQQMNEPARSIWVALALLNVGRMEGIRLERTRHRKGA